jgi:hypothetical protein
LVAKLVVELDEQSLNNELNKAARRAGTINAGAAGGGGGTSSPSGANVSSAALSATAGVRHAPHIQQMIDAPIGSRPFGNFVTGASPSGAAISPGAAAALQAQNPALIASAQQAISGNGRIAGGAGGGGVNSSPPNGIPFGPGGAGNPNTMSGRSPGTGPFADRTRPQNFRGALMQGFFGAWEVGQAYNALNRADAFAMANPNNLEGQYAQYSNAIERATGGIFGGVLGVAFGGAVRGNEAMFSAGRAGNDRADAMATRLAYQKETARALAVSSATSGPVRQAAEMNVDLERAIEKNEEARNKELALASDARQKSANAAREAVYGSAVDRVMDAFTGNDYQAKLNARADAAYNAALGRPSANDAINEQYDRTRGELQATSANQRADLIREQADKLKNWFVNTFNVASASTGEALRKTYNNALADFSESRGAGFRTASIEAARRGDRFGAIENDFNNTRESLQAEFGSRPSVYRARLGEAEASRDARLEDVAKDDYASFLAMQGALNVSGIAAQRGGGLAAGAQSIFEGAKQSSNAFADAGKAWESRQAMQVGLNQLTAFKNQLEDKMIGSAGGVSALSDLSGKSTQRGAEDVVKALALTNQLLADIKTNLGIGQ